MIFDIEIKYCILKYHHPISNEMTAFVSVQGFSNMNNLENYAYIGSYPPNAAESSLNYAIVTSDTNGSSAVPQMIMDKPLFVPLATKRYDVVKPKPSPTVFTIKRYSYPIKDMI